jgi:hypothetical protein
MLFPLLAVILNSPRAAQRSVPKRPKALAAAEFNGGGLSGDMITRSPAHLSPLPNGPPTPNFRRKVRLTEA